MKSTAIITLFISLSLTAGCIDQQALYPEKQLSSMDVNTKTEALADKPDSPKATFASMFPGAWDVEWESERGLAKVEFNFKQHEMEAWFQTDGTWVRTATDLRLSEVPAAVVSAIKNRLGNGWKIDDIDLIEQAEAPVKYYLAECENMGTDIYVRIDPNGNLLNENDWQALVGPGSGKTDNNGTNNNGNGSNNGTSSSNGAVNAGSPKATFASMFPGAWDVEWEFERGLAKVEFNFKQHEMEAWFQTDGTWVRTATDLRLSEVPAAVVSAIKNRLGNGWKIDDIDLIEQAEAPVKYYLAECEQYRSEKETRLRVTPDGVIL